MSYLSRRLRVAAAPAFALTLVGCAASATFTSATSTPARLLPHVVIDSDANNELDDQHAIAYALLSRDSWQIDGITTNRTKAGGDIGQHTAEARRVAALCGRADISVLSGSSGTFDEIKDKVQVPGFDGEVAVDFLIARAQDRSPSDKLILVPVGKLTNVALALYKQPAIAAKVRIVWLGSNWPYDTTEYNEADDHAAVNFLMDSAVEFDVALVRYGKKGTDSGTAAVTVSTEEARRRMPGLGPKVAPVPGRHGGMFSTFGDYSVELFEKIGSRQRALFDMAAVALVKNPSWAHAENVPAPHIVDKQWQERPKNRRRVRFWKDFDRDKIIADFYAVMTRAQRP